jgi:uncharacterized protein (DUF362 family)
LADENSDGIQRRTFLAGALSSFGLASCASTPHSPVDLPDATDAQRKGRKLGRSSIGIISAASYEDDLFAKLKGQLSSLQLPSLKGKHVVLKPNMVEFEAGHPITTHPQIIKAAVQLVDYLGASNITIAEGPGHMRDTEYLLASTGIGAICTELGLPFLDLNLDDLGKKEIENGFSGLPYFYLPKTILQADAVVSLPKMKTHHWVGVTASMKNLFGVVPGRKYGYPKNLLHARGIPNCILDLNRLIRPAFALVDGIVAMEGDGPINGTAKDTKIMVIGDDLAGVDATCARIMGFSPEALSYIRLAGQVIGNISSSDIDIIGAPIATVAQKFERPITYTDANKDWRLLAQSDQQAS